MNKFWVEILEKNRKIDMKGGYLIPEAYDFPKNRWQLFKERHFPCFLKRLMPVKYRRVDMRKDLLKLAREKSIIE